ncbi:hypothetical protein FPV67DRAFT_1448555 [Lyophyllum atratum]|nr:hypothetical protein FPV67DRAFT_1448555 [Lyophyllum atratum]
MGLSNIADGPEPRILGLIWRTAVHAYYPYLLPRLLSSDDRTSSSQLAKPFIKTIHCQRRITHTEGIASGFSNRTPMNGVIGMTELTLDSDLNRSLRESSLLVHSLARSLLLIIEDILDISKFGRIEKGKSHSQEWGAPPPPLPNPALMSTTSLSTTDNSLMDSHRDPHPRVPPIQGRRCAKTSSGPDSVRTASGRSSSSTGEEEDWDRMDDAESMDTAARKLGIASAAEGTRLGQSPYLQDAYAPSLPSLPGRPLMPKRSASGSQSSIWGAGEGGSGSGSRMPPHPPMPHHARPMRLLNVEEHAHANASDGAPERAVDEKGDCSVYLGAWNTALACRDPARIVTHIDLVNTYQYSLQQRFVNDILSASPRKHPVVACSLTYRVLPLRARLLLEEVSNLITRNPNTMNIITPARAYIPTPTSEPGKSLIPTKEAPSTGTVLHWRCQLSSLPSTSSERRADLRRYRNFVQDVWSDLLYPFFASAEETVQAPETRPQASLCIRQSYGPASDTAAFSWPRGRISHSQGAGFVDEDVAARFLMGFQLSPGDLAHIWDLADFNKDNRPTRDGFAIAIHLIEPRRNGAELHRKLPPSLVPPSLRSKSSATPRQFSDHGTSATTTENPFDEVPPLPPKPSSAPMLDAIRLIPQHLLVRPLGNVTANATLTKENKALLSKIQEMEQITSQLLQANEAVHPMAADLMRENTELARRVAELEPLQSRLDEASKTLDGAAQENRDIVARLREVREEAEAAAVRFLEEVVGLKRMVGVLEEGNEELRKRAGEMERTISRSQPLDAGTNAGEMQILMGDVTRENEALKARLRDMERSTASLLLSSGTGNVHVAQDGLRHENQRLRTQVQELEGLTKQLQTSSEDTELQRVLRDVTHENEALKSSLRQASGEPLQREIFGLKTEIRKLQTELRSRAPAQAVEDPSIPPPAYENPS